MADFQYIDFLPEIAADVPGVNEPALVRCVRKAVRYFCDQTGLLTYTFPAIDIVSGEPTYVLPAAPNAQVITVLDEVFVGDQLLVHRSSDQLDREQDVPPERNAYNLGMGGLVYNTETHPWRTLTEYPPRFFFQETPQSLRLVGIPDQDAADALLVTACLKPSAVSLAVDATLIDNWYETIALGAKAYLLQTRQKAWTDIKEGVTRQLQFETLVAELRGQQAAGFGKNDHVIGHVRAYP